MSLNFPAQAAAAWDGDDGNGDGDNGDDGDDGDVAHRCTIFLCYLGCEI